jgi:general secretion pathway protein N
MNYAANKPASAWGWAVMGAVLGVMLALLLFAPARWLAQLVNTASGGQVVLNEARGTVWNGSAQLRLSGGEQAQGSVALPGRLTWVLRPASGGLESDIEAACCMAQALHLQAQVGWGGARVVFADHASHWPAALLAGLGTPWNTVQAQGQLVLSTQGLSVEWLEGRLNLAGRVQLDAQEMASRLSTLKPMGSYRLLVTGGAVNTLQLATLSGSLQLTGSGQWVGGRLRFDGVASAAQDRQEALSNLLNIIGRRDGARSIIKVG